MIILFYYLTLYTHQDFTKSQEKDRYFIHYLNIGLYDIL